MVDAESSRPPAQGMPDHRPAWRSPGDRDDSSGRLVLLGKAGQIKITYDRFTTSERENRWRLLSNVGKSVPGQVPCLSDLEKFPQPGRCMGFKSPQLHPQKSSSEGPAA